MSKFPTSQPKSPLTPLYKGGEGEGEQAWPASHTSGGWKVARGVYKTPAPSENFFRIQTVYDHIAYVRAEHPEGKASASLIAAAPELLEALQAFVDYHEGDFPYEEEDAADGRIPEMAKAMAAIAKAKGETPVPPEAL